MNRKYSGDLKYTKKFQFEPLEPEQSPCKGIKLENLLRLPSFPVYPESGKFDFSR